MPQIITGVNHNNETIIEIPRLMYRRGIFFKKLSMPLVVSAYFCANSKRINV